MKKKSDLRKKIAGYALASAVTLGSVAGGIAMLPSYAAVHGTGGTPAAAKRISDFGKTAVGILPAAALAVTYWCGGTPAAA